jgi:hypothetical protein
MSEKRLKPVIQPNGVGEVESGKIADSIPDGGRQAWLQVMGVFFVWFNTW